MSRELTLSPGVIIPLPDHLHTKWDVDFEARCDIWELWGGGFSDFYMTIRVSWDSIFHQSIGYQLQPKHFAFPPEDNNAKQS